VEKTNPATSTSRPSTAPASSRATCAATASPPNTFRRIVKRHDLLKPAGGQSPKARLAFAKAHANALWQTDTLHGPRLRFRRGEKPVQVFLIAFIDDASRVITHGEFHTADDAENLISTFQTALYKRGLPKAVYADNGSNYSAKEFARICTRPGTVLIHTPVRNGASKGKIERFFRTVRDQFLVRDLGDVSSLRELNDPFVIGPDAPLLAHQQRHFDILEVHARQGGFCLILGEPGTGKSVLKNAVIRHDPKQWITPVINRSLHSWPNLLRLLCQVLELDTAGNDAKCENRLIAEARAQNS
jgi:transposase InsO family protein